MSEELAMDDEATTMASQYKIAMQETVDEFRTWAGEVRERGRWAVEVEPSRPTSSISVMSILPRLHQIRVRGGGQKQNKKRMHQHKRSFRG